jgi:hypothetical protein
MTILLRAWTIERCRKCAYAWSQWHEFVRVQTEDWVCMSWTGRSSALSGGVIDVHRMALVCLPRKRVFETISARLKYVYNNVFHFCLLSQGRH